LFLWAAETVFLNRWASIIFRL